MPNKRDLRLSEYKITSYRYRELYNWCRQYGEWKSKLRECYSLNSRQSIGLNSSGKSDPTATAAIQAEYYSRNVELIEATANAVDPIIGKFIIENVANGTPYEYLGNPPCGRRQFYEYRRKFFYLLDLKKK